MCSTCGARPAGALASSVRALADPEAVLLVDDDDRQAVEDDVGLDQRVRADDERQLAGRELAQHVRPPRGRRRAGEQRRTHRLARKQRLERGEVLLGERLGRCHERGLRAVLDRAQHRVQRDDGLARADLPHQQPLHRPRPGEVGVELGDRARWSPVGANGRSCSRQRAVSDGGRSSAAAVAASRRCGAAAQQRELGEQQLVEREPAAAALEVADVRGDERGGAVGQAGEPAGARGQRLDRVVRGAEVFADQREDLRRGEALRRRVVGDLAARAVLCDVGAWPFDAEAVPRPRTCRAARAACPAGTCVPATAG